jgi:hypothetical protein
MNMEDEMNELLDQLREIAARMECAFAHPLDPYRPCGEGCVAVPPIVDTADGREHDNCPGCGTQTCDKAKLEALIDEIRADMTVRNEAL